MREIIGNISTFIAGLLLILQYCYRVDDEGELRYHVAQGEREG